MNAVRHIEHEKNGIYWVETPSPGGGEDLVVMLIHGTLDRGAGMARLAREVARTHHTIRLDRRGYGRSWTHDGPFDARSQVDDVAMILQGRRAVLIGHSFGGHVALAGAELLGSQIQAVSTFETPLSWMTWWPEGTAGGRGVAAGPENAAETFMVAMIGIDRWNQLPERTREERRREGRALVGELGDLRAHSPWTASHVQCPVVCGYGSHAKEHHRASVEWLVENLPHASATCIDGAYHGAHMSHPREFFVQLVLPHLQ